MANDQNVYTEEMGQRRKELAEDVRRHRDLLQRAEEEIRAINNAQARSICPFLVGDILGKEHGHNRGKWVVRSVYAGQWFTPEEPTYKIHANFIKKDGTAGNRDVDFAEWDAKFLTVIERANP